MLNVTFQPISCCKLWWWGLSDGEKISTIYLTILTPYQRVTDRRTDGRTSVYQYRVLRSKINTKGRRHIILFNGGNQYNVSCYLCSQVYHSVVTVSCSEMVAGNVRRHWQHNQKGNAGCRFQKTLWYAVQGMNANNCAALCRLRAMAAEGRRVSVRAIDFTLVIFIHHKMIGIVQTERKQRNRKLRKATIYDITTTLTKNLSLHVRMISSHFLVV